MAVIAAITTTGTATTMVDRLHVAAGTGMTGMAGGPLRAAGTVATIVPVAMAGRAITVRVAIIVPAATDRAITVPVATVRVPLAAGRAAVTAPVRRVAAGRVVATDHGLPAMRRAVAARVVAVRVRRRRLAVEILTATVAAPAMEGTDFLQAVAGIAIGDAI
jgi:hypothetical protein